jgi:hypothetical protein
MRITIDIADPILRKVKAIQKREGRSLGAVISELLADASASAAITTAIALDVAADEVSR